MIIQYSGRQTGKTTQLIKYAHENDLYIICANEKRVDDILEKAQKMGLYIRHPITVHEIQRGGICGRWIKRILVDELEDVLQSFITIPIDKATTSCDIELLKPFSR